MQIPPAFFRRGGVGCGWLVCGKPGVFDTFSSWKHNHSTQHFEYNVQIYTGWFKFCNILVRIKFHKHHIICSKYYEDNIWANCILALMWIFMVERGRDLGNHNNHLHKQCNPKSKAFRKLFEPKLHIKYRSTMRQTVDLPKGLNRCLISSKKLSLSVLLIFRNGARAFGMEETALFPPWDLGGKTNECLHQSSWQDQRVYWLLLHATQ